MSKAYIVIDLGFGDGGKGATVDFLTRENPGTVLVARYNGGAQAAHNVVTADGKHHTFSQFGSGALAGADTYLSEYMLVNPVGLWNEAQHLEDLGLDAPLHTVSIHKDALLTTPYHEAAARDWARDNPDLSCGSGIWETLDYAKNFPDLALRARDLRDSAALSRKMQKIADYYRPHIAHWNPKSAIEDLYFSSIGYFHLVGSMVTMISSDEWNTKREYYNTLIFEGAQGFWLDETHGFEGFTTSTNCTAENARALLEGFTGDVTTIGVTRMYAVRHGAGPFPTEFRKIDVQHLSHLLPELHNRSDGFQGKFRYGWFDCELIARAAEKVGGVDYLAVSHLDYFDRLAWWNIAPRRADLAGSIHYEIPIHNDAYLAFIERQTKLPIRIVAHGPTAKDRQWVTPTIKSQPRSSIPAGPNSSLD